MVMKVVVVGTGFGRYAVTPAYEALGCEVELVSPRDADAVQAAVAAPCDLVSIHSPPFLHLEHVRLAVSHKRNVLCDKPFGCDAGESREMLDLAVAAGVLHFLNFEFRCDPLRGQMKKQLDAGAIGEPLHLTDTMYLSLGRNAPHGWLFDKDRGGGWIGALASHQVDMLRWLFGDIEELLCRSRIDVKERPEPKVAGGRPQLATAEDAATAWLRMKNGVTACLDFACSAAADLPGQTTLLGTEGVLQLRHNTELLLLRPAQEPESFSPPADYQPLFSAQQSWLETVCRAVEAGQPLPEDFSSGLACATVLDAMRRGATQPIAST